MEQHKTMHRTIFKFIIITLLLNPVYLYPKNTNTKDKLFKKAEKYFFNKKFEMAELLLQQVIKKDPENYNAYAYLGDIFLNKKRYDGALNLYKKAIDLNSNIAENYYRIGQIYYYKKLGNLSIDYFKRSLEIDRKLKFAYYQIGMAYLMLERDKANTIKNWETYIRISPEDPQYEKIKRVIDLLKDPNFIIPSKGSEISIEEALLLGGATLQKVSRKAKNKKAGHEAKKSNKKIKEIYKDDDL